MTPVEIVQRAIMLEDGCGLQFGEERAFCDDPRATERERDCACKTACKAAIAALEAAGYRIVSAETITPAMRMAASERMNGHRLVGGRKAGAPDIIAAAIAAAPVYGKW